MSSKERSIGSPLPGGKIPTGTVTFLFTDIQGSTSKWEKHPQIMEKALVVHDRIFHDAVKSQGGYVFKTVGDAFCVAFQNPLNCLQALIQAFKELEKHQWPEFGLLKVRAGVHTGMAVERDGDYYGPTVNKVARIESAAHGGQIILSTETAALIQNCIPDEMELLDLGEHRLKDLLRPQQLYQLRHPALERDFPPPRSIRTAPDNLPVFTTEFIGRKREREALAELLRTRRLITITGPGGTGKTRIAYQSASELFDLFPKGVFTIEMADHRSMDHILLELMKVLELRDTENQNRIDAITGCVGDGRMLFIFDNCEHLIEESAQLIQELLAKCGQLRILATSREVLQLPGEAAFALAPFDLPQSVEDPDFWTCDSVVFFLNLLEERGVAAPGTREDMGDILEIFRRLDGIPLALELASSRLRTLSLSQLSERLDRRFKTLDRTRRGGLKHQRTLQEVIDWSYRLLEKDEQIFLSMISIFPSSFSLREATAICSCHTFDEDQVEDLIADLIDKSLITTLYDAQENRYRLLETIREFGRDKLTGQEYEAPLEEAFHEYYLTLSAAYDPRSDETRYQQTMARDYAGFSKTLKDLYDQMESGKGTDQAAEKFKKLASNMGWHWFITGKLRDGDLWINRALDRFSRATTEMTAEEKSLYRALIMQKSNLLKELGHHRAALDTLEENETVLFDEAQGVAKSHLLQTFGILYMNNGLRDRAGECLREALDLALADQDRNCQARALLNMGIFHEESGDIDTARDCYRKSVEIFESINARGALAVGYMNLGLTCQFFDEELEESYYRKSLLIFRELGSRGGEAHCSHCLGCIRGSQKDFGAAFDLHQESIRLYFELGDRTRCLPALEELARIAVNRGMLPQASRIFQAMDAFVEERQLKVYNFEAIVGERNEFLKNSLKAEELSEFEALEKGMVSKGITRLSIDEAISLGLSLTFGRP